MSDYFEHYVRSKDLHLKYAKGEPSAKGQEFHSYHEIVLFFGGKARFISKSIQKELSLHSLILVPRASFQQRLREREGTCLQQYVFPFLFRRTALHAHNCPLIFQHLL